MGEREDVPRLLPGPRGQERHKLLSEMQAAVLHHASTLSDKRQSPKVIQKRLASALERLGKEVAEFSPVLGVYRVSPKHFTSRNISIPAVVADLMLRYDFYLLNIPITLLPSRGWDFTELECSVEFNPGDKAAERPVAHEIFPKQEWQDLIRVSQGLSIGLDAQLSFKADAGDLLTELPNIGAQMGAKAHAASKSELVIGPFTYHARRSKILVRGQGNVYVYWRLSGTDTLQTNEPQLAIVLRVPKGLEHVKIEGVMKASRKFDVFAADFHSLMNYVRERTRSFFEQGAPLSSTMAWDSVTSPVSQTQ